MANRFFGLNRGQQENDVVEGSSTGSKSVEVNVDLAAGLDRGEVIIKLKEIINHILKQPWPPA